MTSPGSITDVPGLRVGHAQRTDDGWRTGVTVVLPPPGTVGAVDVRGGGPATHETDALHPASLVPTVDAVVLTGGSAFGLASVTGVQAWCEEAGRGFPTPGGIVPIVPGAALYDLARGGVVRDSAGAPTRPDAAMGRAAAQDAAAQPEGAEVTRGRVGAGTGARVMGASRPGGLGTASVRLGGDEDGGGPVVGALVAVNAHGTPVTVDPADLCDPVPTTGVLSDAPTHPGAQDLGDSPASTPRHGTNTTLAVVATDLALTVAQTEAVCRAAHAGMARALDPVHSLVDGDVVFGLATGTRPLPEDADAVTTTLLQVQQAAATAVQRAIADGVSRRHG
ncbi:P1 family peptidase [Kytococcus schroeteri]|uniref:P1 family peptidase n=2 Tax=Kytococcus schroeteri TaxID=138300 RepID=UPI0035E46FD1